MISVNNLTKNKVSAVFLKKVAKIVLKGENIRTSSLRSKIKKDKDLSIVLIGPTKIKELNQKYRKKNQTTNVLSFEGGKDFLGEIVICPNIIKKNAANLKSNFKKELTFVLIHGLLHLLGYDHERSKKEAEIMDKKTRKHLFKINF